MKKNVVIFAPHPDDETLGCGGVIAKKVKEGYNIVIIFMTDGRNALKELGVYSNPSPFELKEIRKKEAETATEILGVNKKNLVFLDIEDGALEKNMRTAEKRITKIYFQ